MVLNLFIAIVIATLIGSLTVGSLNHFVQNNHFLSYYQLSLIFISYLAATVVTSVIQQLVQDKKGSTSNSKQLSHEDSSDREQGIVKWFNVNKGFGFITQENGDDIFVHYRSIRGQGRKKLIDGQTVSYVVINSDRGLQADDVEILS